MVRTLVDILVGSFPVLPIPVYPSCTDEYERKRGIDRHWTHWWESPKRLLPLVATALASLVSSHSPTPFPLSLLATGFFLAGYRRSSVCPCLCDVGVFRPQVSALTFGLEWQLTATHSIVCPNATLHSPLLAAHATALCATGSETVETSAALGACHYFLLGDLRTDLRLLPRLLPVL